VAGGSIKEEEEGKNKCLYNIILTQNHVWHIPEVI
jgi:hypothetical protein